jgi:putative membrane protein
MEILNNVLFWIHLVSLSLGGAATFGIPVVGSMMATATPDTRPTLFKVAHGLSSVGRAGLGGLIITGPLLVWLKFGGTAGFTTWFWAKMVLVVLLIVVVVWAGMNAKRAEGGDMAAAKRAPMIGGLGLVLLLGVVLCAVFAFN